MLSFLKNVPFSTSPLPHSGVFFKRSSFYSSFSALIVFIVFNLVKYVNPVTGVAFIGCGRDNYRMLWSSITFIKKIQNKRCMCRVLHVGGKPCYMYSKIILWSHGCRALCLKSHTEQIPSLLHRLPNFLDII